MSSLEILTRAATIISWLASFVAAMFWFLASRTKIPPFPDVGWGSGSWVFEPVRKALKAGSRRNAIAAFFSGVATLAYAFANSQSILEAIESVWRIL